METGLPFEIVCFSAPSGNVTLPSQSEFICVRCNCLGRSIDRDSYRGRENPVRARYGWGCLAGEKIGTDRGSEGMTLSVQVLHVSQDPGEKLSADD